MSYRSKENKKDSPATKAQLDYIFILSSYKSTRLDDLHDIVSFLMEKGKKDLRELTKGEASELIQVLLERPVEYEFPCGLKALLEKQEINRINVWGELEGCLDYCPKGIDVNE
ncbi:MAG: hypothetical protein ACPLZG_13520, partial [Thermoproteota archaeon]